MCYDGGDEELGRQSAGPDSPSRRAFSRLLLAGTGLAALSACTPAQSYTPSGTPGPTPTPGIGSATPTAAAASTSPLPASAAPESSTPSAPQTPATSSAIPPSAAAGPPSAAAPGPQHSLSDPTSPWVIVNKHRPLSPATFVPPDLVRPAVRLATYGEAALLNSTTAAAAEKMFAAAAADGVIITLASGYRSFTTQRATYNNWVNTLPGGSADADTASARPGYSEHQTGWAFDIGDGSGADSFKPGFKDRPAAIWAKANAHRFGFVVRYPWMLHEITGYFYEPWHLRFIGTEAATDMSKRGIGTLEEYFGLEAAPAYL
jgi:zinc D-Ala-D-Ala carboxypeptidase